MELDMYGVCFFPKTVFITLLLATVVTGQQADITTEVPSDVNTTSTPQVNNNVTGSDIIIDDSTLLQDLPSKNKCLHGSGACDNATAEGETTKMVTATEPVSSSIATSPLSTEESSDSAASSPAGMLATISDSNVTTEGLPTSVSLSSMDNLQNASTDSPVSETTPAVSHSFSDGASSTAINATTEPVSATFAAVNDTSTGIMPSSSADWSTTPSVMVSNITVGKASVPSSSSSTGRMDTSTTIMPAGVTESFMPINASDLITPTGSSQLPPLTDAGQLTTPTDSGQLTTPTDSSRLTTPTDSGQVTTPTDSSQVTTPMNVSQLPTTPALSTPSTLFNVTSISTSAGTSPTVPVSPKDNVTTQLPQKATAAVSTTSDYVDPFYFHIDPPEDNVTVSTSTLSTTAMAWTTTVNRTDQSGLTDWWTDIQNDPDNLVNETQAEEIPADSETTSLGYIIPVSETVPLQNLTSTPTPSHSTTVTPLPWENATDNLILPDESKHAEVVGPFDGAESELLLPPVVSGAEPDMGVRPTPWTVTDLFPVTEPAMIPKPEVKQTDPIMGPDIPTKAPKSPWWPSVEHNQVEEENKTQTPKPGTSSQDLLDKFQMVFLVAPCVGALLAVIGATCVIRCATANCRKRRKILRKIKKQQKEEENKQKEEEKRRKEETKKKQREKKKSPEAHVKEENETDAKGHKRPKHHHHNHHHRNHDDDHHHQHHHRNDHRHHNGQAVGHQGDKEHRGVKKSHKK